MGYMRIFEFFFTLPTYDSHSSTERMLREINCKEKNLRIIARGGAIIFQKKWLLQMKKTFSSHDRKMKRIIPKHNESSWYTLERSHAEGERKKDETSLSHRHHKNFSFIHSYIRTNLLFYHDTLVWTLASFLTISTNHDKVKEKKYSLHIWDVR